MSMPLSRVNGDVIPVNTPNPTENCCAHDEVQLNASRKAMRVLTMMDLYAVKNVPNVTISWRQIRNLVVYWLLRLLVCE